MRAEAGVEVGDRWVELADKAEARIGGCLSAFTLPHGMMALAATGRDDAAHRMIDGMRAFARGNGTIERLAGKVALPLCEAVLAHGQGRHADALCWCGRSSATSICWAAATPNRTCWSSSSSIRR